MAKGKRVSNKSGGDPGKRSSKTIERYRAKRRFARRSRTPVTVPNVVHGRGPAPVKKPPVMARAVSHVKRFFSRGPK